MGCIGDRERFGPPGVFGGEEGRRAGLVINAGTENERNVGIFAVSEPVRQGDVVHHWSSGGGGYGDPLERAPSAVLDDVMNDYISVEGARDDHGVVVTEVDRRRLLFEIDEDATKKLRDQRKSAARSS